MGREEVRINDIGSEEDLLAAIDAHIRILNDGDIVEGRIVKVDREEVLVDIGYKTEGVIPARELSIKHDVDPSEVVEVGDEVEALVLQKEDKKGRLILSKKRAQYERAWGTIEKIKAEDGVVTGTVIEVVQGGLILDIGLPGFLPASLVEVRRVRNLQRYIGHEMEVKIIELDRNRNSVVLSRRAWLEQIDARAALAISDMREQLADGARELDELREQLADGARELDELREQLADKAQELDELREQLADRAGELGELRAATDAHMRQAEDARTTARGLWAAMPPEGRLTYFESGSSWLPEWIVGKDE